LASLILRSALKTLLYRETQAGIYLRFIYGMMPCPTQYRAMLLESTEKNFRADQPWRTLLNLYWPERRWVLLAML